MEKKNRRSNSKWKLKDLIKYASEARHNNGGIFIAYVFDIIIASHRYKMTYKEYSIYQFYKLEKNDRLKFLMMSDAERINQIYNIQGNSKETLRNFDDKRYFVKAFKDFTKRPFIDLQSAGQNRFNDFVKDNPLFVSKSVVKREGDFVEKHLVDETTDLVALRSDLIAKKEFLLEPYLQQHSELAKLYPESLNTVRVITFRDDQDEVHILNVALKLGSGGIRDNYSRGGLFSVPNEEGLIVRPFVNKKGAVYESHPSTNEALVGFKIPFFDDVLEFALACADVIPSVRYVGWDIAIQDEELLLLDGSLLSKFFQTPPVVTQSTGEEIHNLRAVYEYVMPEIIKIKKSKKRD